jgi:two-component system nitrate/nitrite response regulator NarL
MTSELRRPVTRVCLVTDIRLYREALADALTRHGSLIVGAAVGVDEALELVRNVRANIVILDMATARKETIRALAETPGIRVVALGVRETEHEVVAWAEAGASGLVPCDSSIDDLVAIVESVSRGETRCSPRMVAALFRRVADLASERSAETAEAHLTPRERDILALIRDGLSNKEIAKRLCIEVPTVKNHVHNILAKLNVRRRGEAAAFARRMLLDAH